MKSNLTNEQLIDKVKAWVKKLCETGGSAWTLKVPVDLDNDPDVLIIELCNRFASQPPSGNLWEEVLISSGELPDGTDNVWVKDQFDSVDHHYATYIRKYPDIFKLWLRPVTGQRYSEEDMKRAYMISPHAGGEFSGKVIEENFKQFIQSLNKK